MQYISLKNSLLFFDEGNYIYSFDGQLVKKNMETRRYGSWPEKENYKKIKSLTFILNSSESKKITKFPDFISELPNLESLGIPIDFLEKIKKIPIHLKSLRLFKPVFSDAKIFDWPEKLILNKLLFISVPELISPFIMDFNKTPNLEWIEFDLQGEKNESVLYELGKLKKLKHINFLHAKNFEILDPFIHKNILSIELFACTGKKFTINKLSEFKKLKYLYINNITPPLDCNLIIDLPELIEVNIKNVKKVLNIESLLKIKKLKALNVMNCNKPISKASKDLFIKHGLEELTIDFA